MHQCVIEFEDEDRVAKIKPTNISIPQCGITVNAGKTYASHSESINHDNFNNAISINNITVSCSISNYVLNRQPTKVFK